MPNTVLNSKTIKKRIETRLGSSGVFIELEDDDINESISQAVKLYNQIRPAKRRARSGCATMSPTLKGFALGLRYATQPTSTAVCGRPSR